MTRTENSLQTSSGVRKMASRGVMAIIDQGVVSATNFLGGWSVAALIPDQASFGAYSLVYSLFWFFSMQQNAVIIEPMIVIGTQCPQQERAKAFVAGCRMQLAFAGVLACCLWGSGLVLHLQWPHTQDDLALALVGMGIAIAFLQFRETIRRIFYTENMLWAVLIIDLAACFLIVLGIGGLYHFGVLTVWRILLLQAVATGISCFYGALLLRQRLTAMVANVREFLKEAWPLIRWNFVGATATSVWTQASTWVLAMVVSTVEVGRMNAARQLVSPAQLAVVGLGGLLFPRLCQAATNASGPVLRRKLLESALLSLLLVSPVLLVLSIFPDTISDTIYRGNYPEISGMIRLWCMIVLIGSLRQVLSFALRALRRPDLLARIILPIAVFSVGSCAVFSYFWKAYGALSAYLASEILLLVLLWFFFRRLSRTSAKAQGDALNE